MDEHTCDTCRWWGEGPSDMLGCRECHRYPPTVPIIEHVTHDGVEVHLLTDGGDTPYVTYPKTSDEEWCGEWRAK